MADTKKNINWLNNFLFLVANISAKLKLITNPALAGILNIIALSAYLLAYLTWSMLAWLSDSPERLKDKFYGFEKYQDQQLIAAVIGLITTLLCIIIPQLIIPILWLYTISNIIWSISEYHLQQNPPQDILVERQSLYFKYSIYLTSNSAISAISLSLIFLMPQLAPIITISSFAIGFIVAIPTIYFWLQYICYEDPTLKPIEEIEITGSSYKEIRHSLPRLAPKPSPKPKPDATITIITQPWIDSCTQQASPTLLA